MMQASNYPQDDSSVVIEFQSDSERSYSERSHSGRGYRDTPSTAHEYQDSTYKNSAADDKNADLNDDSDNVSVIISKSHFQAVKDHYRPYGRICNNKKKYVSYCCALVSLLIVIHVIMTIIFNKYDNKKSSSLVLNVTHDDKSSESTLSPSSTDDTAGTTFEQEQPPYNLKCIGDRILHETQLRRGEFLCSRKGLYVMGLTELGDLLWMNLANTTEKFIYYDNYAPQPAVDTDDSVNITTTSYEDEYFMLKRNGNIEVVSGTKNNVEQSTDTNHTAKNVWLKRHKNKYGKIAFSDLCLPDYPCPYLHIHSEGVVVLNWIDEETEVWMQKNINRVYDF